MKDPHSLDGQSGPGIKPSWHNHVTAVTGTIGSGKSTFIELLKQSGAYVISADDLAKEVVAPGTKGLQAVVAAFGPQILTATGEMDRSKLGAIVFSDQSKRKQLEGILHPLIAALAETRFREFIAAGKEPLVYEVPLLFEAKLDKAGFKRIIVVTANDDICVERQMKRKPGTSESDARARIAAQLSVDEKRARADIVVDNSGSLDALKGEVQRLFPTL